MLAAQPIEEFSVRVVQIVNICQHHWKSSVLGVPLVSVCLSSISSIRFLKLLKGTEVSSASKARVLGATFAGLAPLAVGVPNSSDDKKRSKWTWTTPWRYCQDLPRWWIYLKLRYCMVLPSCLVHVLFFDNTVQHSHNIPKGFLGSASQLRWSNLLQPQLDFLEPKNPRLGARMPEVARSCYTNVSVQFCLPRCREFWLCTAWISL